MDLFRFISAAFGIFANTIYSHHSLQIRFKIFAQIRIKIFNLLQNKYIFSYWPIFASKNSFRSECSQNFKQISHSSKFANKRIFACNYLHTRAYLLANIRILATFRFVLLQNYKGQPFTILGLN
jgi:hypothetical protein